MNRSYLSPKPSLTQRLLLEPHLKKVENLLQLTLQLVPVILESLGWIIVFVDLGIKEIVPSVDPWHMEKEKLVSNLVDKTLIRVIATSHIHSFFV